MLVYDQILERVKEYEKFKYEKTMIENFKEKNLQSVSYDVTMGSNIMKFKDECNTIYLDDKESIDNLYEKVSINMGYKLRPGEFVLARLNERVNMPKDIAGHIRPRTTFNKLGLLITSQHINPTYSGNLQIGIRNCSPNIIVLKPNLKIAQIVFEEVDEPIKESELYKNKETSKYQDEDEFVGSKVYHETYNENELNKILNELLEMVK